MTRYLLAAALFAALAVFSFTACSVIESAIPATRGDIDAIESAMVDKAQADEMTAAGLEEGNLMKVIFGSGFSLLSAISVGVGLSRKRRAPQIQAEKDAKLLARINEAEAAL